MEDNNPFLMLAILSVFSLVGGAVMGNALRALRARQHIVNSFFALIWASIFAGAPLLSGAGLFFSTDQTLLFVIQLGLFAAAVCYTLFVRSSSIAAPAELPLVGVVVGGILTMAGAVLVSSFMRRGGSMALWGGLLMLLIGAGILIAAAYFAWIKLPERIEEPAAAEIAREESLPGDNKKRKRRK